MSDETTCETAHLLSSPANARRLLKALQRADARQTDSSTIEQLRRDVGLEATITNPPGPAPAFPEL